MPLPPLHDSARAGVRVLVVDYLKVLHARRWLALTVFLAVVLGAAAYTFTRVPLYEAQVTVLIDFDEPNVIDFPQVFDEGARYANYSQTQHELLQSRALAERTADAMALWKRPDSGVPTREAAIGGLRGALQISPIRGTRMVQVRIRWPEPAMATEMANAHARQYVELSLEKRFLASKIATEWLDGQLAEERERVEASESALQAFREQRNAVSLEDGQNIVVQKLADLNGAVTRAKTNRIEKEAQYRELLAIQQDRAAVDAFPAILTNSFIQQLKGNLATLQREHAQLSETLGELHPTLVEKRTALDTTEQRLSAEIARVVDSVQSAYQGALAEEQSLMRALEEQKREALALNRQGIEYAALEREAESVRTVYESLLQRARETAVSRDLRATNVQIVDAALPPRRPVYPRTDLTLLLSLFGGLFLAVGVAFVVEAADDRIKTPADVTGHLGQRFLGLVPEMRAAEPAGVSLLQDDAPAVVAEAFRTIRTSLVSAMPTDSPFSLLVASGSEGEGKTHVASNLAVALARAQHNVVLVDADLRRPSVHVRFGDHRDPGLSNVLAGTATLNQALRPTAVRGLTVLTAGAASEQAPELLGSALFGELLNLLREHYSCVIIDSPPTLTVTDARILAGRTTAVLFVVGSATTRTRMARLAIDELQRAGGQVVGTVLNRADVVHNPFYFSPYAPGEYLESLERTAGENRAAASLA